MEEKKILIVDDQEEILEILEVLIEGSFPNLKTVMAHSGNQAADLLDHEDFDAIICDYRMPEGNGDVVYLKNKEKKNIPFAWHSATVVDDLKKLVDQVEDDAIMLVKPIVESELIDTVTYLLDEKTYNPNDYRKVKPCVFRNYGEFEKSVFVKINEKFIAINKAGEPLTKEAIEIYEIRGADFFYVEEESFKYLSHRFIERLKSRFENCHSIEDVYFTSTDMITLFKKNLIKIGLTNEELDLVNSCVEASLRELNKNIKIKELMSGVIDKDNYISSHSLVTIYICKVLGFDIDSDEFNLLSKISILHDLDVRNERLAKVSLLEDNLIGLTPAELSIVNDHGENIANIITQDFDFPREARSTLINHHKIEKCTSVLEKKFYLAHEIAHVVCTDGLSSVVSFLRSNESIFQENGFNGLIELAISNFEDFS